MSIIRYHRKPQPREGALYAARYEPGQPLDDLGQVARMTDRAAEVTEVTSLPSGPVALVRYYRSHDDHPSEIDWEVVQPGEFLCWSETCDNLTSDTERGLAQFYDEAENGQNARPAAAGSLR